MSPSLEIILIASTVAAACALVGTFLVLRGVAMMSDAISHSVLLGIVLAFFVVEQLNHPLMIVGAALTGILTVALVEMLQRTRLVRQDAAIGLVFPALFSIAVLLINRYAGDVHLDQDVVLLGELVFAPFNRWSLLGIDLPAGLWTMGSILLIDAAVIGLLYKEFKLATFDEPLAAALGFSPVLLHYLLMTLVSITAVGAFDAVGAILVVALMVAPPATAFMLTRRLSRMLALSLLFGLSFLLAPERGLVAQSLRRRRQRREFAVDMLLVHLHSHEDEIDAAEENAIPALQEHLRWEAAFAAAVLRRARSAGLVEAAGGDRLLLRPAGRERARQVTAR